MNSKMTINSQLSTTEPKNKNKLSKQLEQEQNHRNGDHMEGYQWWSGRGVAEQRHIKGRKKWDNSNSILNKMYLKKE